MNEKFDGLSLQPWQVLCCHNGTAEVARRLLFSVSGGVTCTEKSDEVHLSAGHIPGAAAWQQSASSILCFMRRRDAGALLLACKLWITLPGLALTENSRLTID